MSDDRPRPVVEIGQQWRLKPGARPRRDGAPWPELLQVCGPDLWTPPGSSYFLRAVSATGTPLEPVLSFGCEGLAMLYAPASGEPMRRGPKPLGRLRERVARADADGAAAVEVDREDLRAALGHLDSLEHDVVRLQDELHAYRGRDEKGRDAT